jgi:5-formyltetrahydrofolate cyclo-ligase
LRIEAIQQRNLTSERKAALRAEASALRWEVFSRAGAAAAAALVDRGVEAVSSFEGISSIGGYFPIRDELDALPLLRALNQRGFQIALPRILPGPALEFRRWISDTPLVRGKFGVQEPPATEPELTPELVIVPLLAFDRLGNRLGYGAGYYDSVLRSLRKERPVVAIGMGFDEQEVAEIPCEPQDETLNMILTPSRFIICGE